MSSKHNVKRLGLIGLGAVGHRLGVRLLEQFAQLTVLDIDPEKVEALTALGAEQASNACELAHKCDVVLLSLPSPTAVENVMTGSNGLLEGIGRATVIVDTSTLSPDSSRHWADKTTEYGGFYLDAPVTCSITRGGGTAAAQCGELTFLIGGEREAYDSVLPVLEPLGRSFHHLGSAGAGSTMKLVSNHIAGIQTLAIAEALNLARACGFSNERTLDVCADTVANSYVLESIIRPRLHNTSNMAHFAIELMTKDHRLAQELAQSNGVELPMNAAALELCERMCAAGYSQRDNVSSIEFFAKLRENHGA